MFLELATQRRSIRQFVEKPVAPEAVAQGSITCFCQKGRGNKRIGGFSPL